MVIKCKKCGKKKEVTEFTKVEGYYRWCNSCVTELYDKTYTITHPLPKHPLADELMISDDDTFEEFFRGE